MGNAQKKQLFRMARGVKYAALSAAAVVSLFHPSVIIVDSFKDDLSVFAPIWSIVLLLGAGFSLMGTVTKTWVGEYVGLWGVISCTFLYSLGIFANWDELTGQRVFIGLCFFALSSSAFARRQDVVFQKSMADYEKRVKSKLPGV